MYCLVPYLLLTDAEACHVFCQSPTGASPFDTSAYFSSQVSLANSRDLGSLQFMHTGQAVSDQLWDELDLAERQNYIMCAWSMKEERSPELTPDDQGDGVIRNVLYCVVTVLNVFADGRDWRVVQLRNPWARVVGTEWSGPLSDAWQDWPYFP